MRIIIFCAYFHPHQGGVENYIEELFKTSNDNRNNLEITLVTANTENSKECEKYKNFDVYRLPCWNILGGTYPVIKPSGWKILRELSKRQQKEKYDYVITSTRFFNTSLLGARFALKNKIPLIHIEHGTAHSPVHNLLSRTIGIIYDHTFGRYIIKHADKAIGISIASEKFIKHLYNKDNSKIFLLRNGIDTKKFVKITRTKDIQNIRKSLHLKNEKIIVYVGRLIYAKGVHDLLEATKDRNDVKVIVIGSGNYDNKLRSISKNAIFLGQKNSDEIIKYLSIADIFVNPSYAEGLPTSVLEAGSLGVPIIATDVGGTREIIDDEKNGFLIKPKDVDGLKTKITLLLNNPSVSNKFSLNIRKKIIKEFDWKKTRFVLEKILGKKK